MRAILLPILLLAPALLAGCTNPSSSVDEDCVPVAMSPLDDSLTPGETFVILTVEVSNCGDAALALDAGPCGYDLLPRLSRDNETWVLKDGAALRPESLDCTEPSSSTTLQPGKTARISARWNGLLENATREFPPAPAGEYETSVSALDETVSGKVRVL